MKEINLYDVTIIVRGRGGSVKVKLGDIKREDIFSPGYPKVIRALVEMYEHSISEKSA